MSVQQEIKRLTAPDVRARKGGEPTCASPPTTPISLSIAIAT